MTKGDVHLPIHGNYRSYHGYLYHHPGGSDRRLSLLDSQLFRERRVLDIGCNEGWISCEIAQCHGARHVIGVDIDDTLVRMAWKRRRVLWSLQEPNRQPEIGDTDKPRLTKRREKGSDSLPERRGTGQSQQSPRPRPDYFPAYCAHMFGYLPLPSDEQSSSSSIAFPNNVVFRCADWVNERISEDDGGYDVIVALSVSKWIHLNHGDEGLNRFFRRVYDCLTPGGAFIFEPQTWDSYTKARKLSATLQEDAKSLKIRPEEFQTLLEDIGFQTPQRLGASGYGRFHRPIYIYVKPADLQR